MSSQTTSMSNVVEIQPGISRQQPYFHDESWTEGLAPKVSSERQRRFVLRFLPFLAGVTLTASGVIAEVTGTLGHSRSKENAPIPTLNAIEHETGDLRSGTPNLTLSQLAGWPVRETVTVTARQAGDGPSAIAGAIDPEVFNGGPNFSNDQTKAALESDVENQALADHGSTFIQPGESFSVADIHPSMPNVVTGGNRDIPNS